MSADRLRPPSSDDPPSLPGDHPALDQLQRYADELLDGDREAGVVNHVAQCTVCQQVVEEIRRTNAALALASSPPADLFSRIRARRVAENRAVPSIPQRVTGDAANSSSDSNETGDHPLLEDLNRYADEDCDTDSDTQLIEHIASCARCQQEVEEARRGAVALSLLASPPSDLLTRIKARRSQGARVLLPEVPPIAYIDERYAARSGTMQSAASRLLQSRPAARQHVQFSRFSGVGTRVSAVAASVMLAVLIGRVTWQATGMSSVKPRGRVATALDTARLVSARPDSVAPSPAGRSTNAKLGVPPLTRDTGVVGFQESPPRRERSTPEQLRWNTAKMALSQIHLTFAGIGEVRESRDSLSIRLNNMLFDGPRLTASGVRVVNEIARIVVFDPNYRVAAIPHQSPPNLGMQRVLAVRAALLETGLDASRIVLGDHVGDQVARQSAVSAPSSVAEIVVIIFVPHLQAPPVPPEPMVRFPR